MSRRSSASSSGQRSDPTVLHDLSLVDAVLVGLPVQANANGRQQEHRDRAVKVSARPDGVPREISPDDEESRISVKHPSMRRRSASVFASTRQGPAGSHRASGARSLGRQPELVQRPPVRQKR